MDANLPEAIDELTHNASCSPSSHLLHELQLHGYRPFEDEPDPRPLPEPEAAEGAIDAVFDAIGGLLADTRLADEAEGLLWGVVNLLHRRVEHLERRIDENETAQRKSQAEQDGSEVRSVDLERLIGQGLSLIEARNAFEFLREAAAQRFAAETGSSWRPALGLARQSPRAHLSRDRQPRIHQCPPPRRASRAVASWRPHRLCRRARLQ